MHNPLLSWLRGDDIPEPTVITCKVCHTDVDCMTGTRCHKKMTCLDCLLAQERLGALIRRISDYEGTKLIELPSETPVTYQQVEDFRRWAAERYRG